MYQAGDLSGAEGHLDALVQTLPENPNVLHLLSLVRLRLDKADAAAQSLKTLTDVAPGSAEAHELYGIALRQAGRVNGAIRQFNRALEITPDSASLHYNLGNAYRDDHQVDQAITHYSRAVELDPENLNARFNLGQAYVSQQDWKRATGAFVALVDRAPQDAEAQRVLADTAHQAKAYAVARKACEAARQAAPDDAELTRLYAEIMTCLGEYETAAACYDSLLGGQSSDTGILRLKAANLRAMGDADGALAAYAQAVAINPADPGNRTELGRLQERMNRLDDAWETISPGLEALPGDPGLNLVAARLERRSGDHDKALARLKGLDQKELTTSPAFGEIRFEMGFLYEGLDRPGDAVENFEAGNAFLAKDTQEADLFRARSREYLARLRQAYDGLQSGTAVSTAARQPQDGAADPVFLIGFPRSGTTLLDQVMDAHPGIQVLEEQPTVSTLRNHLLVRDDGFPANLFTLSADDLLELRELYFKTVDRLIDRDPAARLVDKLPLNILDAGLIKRVFPDAKFILALRHPCDICLSCFMQPFDLNEGMVHFTSLDETVRFYADVMELWQIQRDALDLDIHEIRYEDLVQEIEPVARKLMDFLDVSWDDKVLDPAAHARRQTFIGTSSYHQVTENVTTKAVGRWRKFEIHLAPHLNRLRPFIKAFGYSGTND